MREIQQRYYGYNKREIMSFNRFIKNPNVKIVLNSEDELNIQIYKKSKQNEIEIGYRKINTNETVLIKDGQLYLKR